MNRQRTRLLLIFIAASLFLVTLNFSYRPATIAAPSVDSGHDKEAMSGQIKELQKQVAELQTQVNDLNTPRIVVAGTATLRFGAKQENKTSTRVKLPKNLIDKLGDTYIVQLTNRYPTTPDFHVPYWKPAADGFDILLANPALVGIGLNTDQKAPYHIDWIVVKR